MTTWIIFSIFTLLLFVTTTFILEFDLSNISSTSILNTIIVFNRQSTQFPLDCPSSVSAEATCSTYYPTKTDLDDDSSTTSCPEYFRWMHEDLKPWRSTGITRDMVESGKNISNFRLVILNGKAYVDKFAKSFQTRDVFTIWGILQLLRLYPGKVPDLELMFHCGDKSVVDKSSFKGPLIPPVFHYCGDKNHYDIVFPDWTFWGWPELNIRPWETTLHNIQEGNKIVKWKDRVPYAFWKGNPVVSVLRKALVKCNATDQHDWNARIYDIQWKQEKANHFEGTKLENQCTYRYKIYAEGATWSVSEKYIIACDSMTMFIEPRYYDFFSRNMVPLQHYWPISSKNMCEAIKYAVDWGNSRLDNAQAIGNGGTNYIVENLKMKFVYDYMFHLLNGYAKLMRFKPSIPIGGVEICSQSLACSLRGVRKHYMGESMVKSPSDTAPCSMPPPYTTQTLQKLLQEKANLIQQVNRKEVN
ncbi:hypothetical protein RJT34_15504 [Clitoria ternatea]|uniref:Glycosyl transferase CAP10 domain-containing protein n=1 Tax=Clitoria ternatea TaxID=43366 RepID=A0AAN9PBH4_CLITE